MHEARCRVYNPEMETQVRALSSGVGKRRWHGMALQDLYVAAHVLARARADGLGREL